jgi:tetratricopeptide (TPR) repeat protein
VDSHVIALGPGDGAEPRATGPLQSGPIPALAANYEPRPETGIDPWRSPLPGEILVLTGPGQYDASGRGPGGGVGKTQLAAATAVELLRNRTVDLVLWVTAANRDGILACYAQALADLAVADMRNDLETAAPMTLEWLASTRQPWLVVLDDLADFRDLDGLWPQGARNRVLVTAREGATVQGATVRTKQIGPFSHREAVNYLTVALKDDPDLRLGAPELAADMQGLPIGMALAVPVIIDRRLDCRTYHAALAERIQILAGSWRGRCPLPVLAAWSLAVDHASNIVQADLAWRTLALVSLLDPAGVPESVVTSDAACSFLVDRPGATSAEYQAQVRSAVGQLARLGLLTLNPASTTRTVRMQTQLGHAVRGYVSADYRDWAGRAAADALLQSWGEAGSAELEYALRECADSLSAATGDLLWQSGCHPVLARAGASRSAAGLPRSAVSYWQAMLSASGRLLGEGHPDTEHARVALADGYERTGHTASAIAIYERALSDAEQSLGAGHTDTLAALAKLASGYLQAGRTDDAVAVYRRNLAARERVHGPRDPDTITARSSLADCYRQAGQFKEAIDLYERVLSDRERVQGLRHMDTLAARANLAFAYRSAGRMREAIPAYARTLADREQVQGAHHPDTLAARGNLASAYHSAGRLKDAIPVYERTLQDWEQVHGSYHPRTLTARGNLASAYHSARRLADAIRIYERTITDCEAVLGHDHPDTLTLRSNLGLACHTAGRLADAIAIFRRTVADSEQALGPDHPLTQTARENLNAVTEG